MISNSFLFEIKTTIDKNKRFSNNDFLTITENHNLKIVYLYDDKYFFDIKIPIETSKLSRTINETQTIGFTSTRKEIEYYEYEFSGKVCPGSIVNEERITFEGKSKLIQHLSEWLSNLWQELTIKPELRRLNEIEEEIKNINEKFTNISEENFTKEEANILIDKLNKLEEQFKEKLEAEIQDKAILKATLAELHLEIEKLKGQSKILNKKNWFKSFGGKMFNWISKEENRKFLKDTGEFIKPLLPDSIDKII
ncbi:hypothetical protein SAMN05660493_02766 [Epilithonimonas bovis DSM 19482]|uniref:Uncharacterized protein n=1 Tax=Epilithonimonas bovis DSM 19482 TaxID=1121284 RepID=A0A1U7PWV3_9FLAO|nr:hypothetical protein [Epilithonimonas bovis]SIT98035.1 hypothetical protein SAMN05660493_02766 [Epilithonimonas bovis DSM 19482]